MMIEVSRMWLALLYVALAVSSAGNYGHAPPFELINPWVHKAICLFGFLAWSIAAAHHVAVWLIERARRARYKRQ